MSVIKATELGFIDANVGPEKQILNRAALLWNDIVELEKNSIKYSHPDDMRNCRDAIHMIQDIMMARVIRKVIPDLLS